MKNVSKIHQFLFPTAPCVYCCVRTVDLFSQAPKTTGVGLVHDYYELIITDNVRE